MEAYTRLFYVYKFPPTEAVEAVSESSHLSTAAAPPRVQVAGVFALCPMVEASPQSRPSAIVEYFAKGIKFFAGSLPLAKSVRGEWPSTVVPDNRQRLGRPACRGGLFR